MRVCFGLLFFVFSTYALSKCWITHTENHEKGGLGWSREAPGGALGAILELLGELWEPFWTQERPKLKNHDKSDIEDPPQGPVWKHKFQKKLIWVQFVQYFYVFV